jgi:prolyl 4-hydroxylase
LRRTLELAEPIYEPSPLSKGADLKTYDKEIRSSMSAVVLDDPIVACVEQRSVEFQGYMPVSHLEDLQVVKYDMSDHFRPHYDWWQGMVNPRISTFFVYLTCDDVDGSTCEGGISAYRCGIAME